MTVSGTISPFVTIWFFTYIGVLCRAAVTTLCEIVDQNLILQSLGYGFFMPNLIGSFIMGILTGIVDLCKLYQAWHVGITVGFCGCCTTFSAWQKSVAVEFLAARWVVALTQMFTTYVGSYTSFCCGLHFGTIIVNFIQGPPKPVTPVIEYKKSKFSTSLFILLIFNIIITVALWCGIFLDTNALYRQMWWTSLALAPFGSFVRFALAKLNRGYPTFPLFTFLVNAVGSALSMSFFIGQHFMLKNHSAVAIASYNLWVLNGLTVGTMGSLTTVSTFVKELYYLGDRNIKYSYRYGLVSVFVIQVCCLLIGCALFA